jgi:hypothetical protein
MDVVEKGCSQGKKRRADRRESGDVLGILVKTTRNSKSNLHITMTFLHVSGLSLLSVHLFDFTFFAV